MKNIILTGKDFKLTQPLKDYVTQKMNKVNKFAPRDIIEIKVELDIDKNQKKGLINRVEMSVQLPGKILKAGLKAENMREAIDLCLPKLVRRIKKYKTIKSKSKQPGSISIRKP